MWLVHWWRRPRWVRGLQVCRVGWNDKEVACLLSATPLGSWGIGGRKRSPVLECQESEAWALPCQPWLR